MTNYHEEVKTHIKGLSVALEKLTVAQVEEHLAALDFVETTGRVIELLESLTDVASKRFKVSEIGVQHV